jgi:hypothetical protein
MTSNSSLARAAALAGLASVILNLMAIAVIASGPFPSTYGAADLPKAVLDIVARPAVSQIAAVLFGLILAANVPFAACLAGTLNAPKGLIWSAASLLIAASVLNVAAGFGPYVVGSELARQIAADDVAAKTAALALVGLTRVTDTFANFVAALGLAGLAAAQWQDGRFPRWLAYVGGAAALGGLLVSLTIMVPALNPAVNLAPLLTLVWLAGMSWVLWQLPEQASAQE